LLPWVADLDGAILFVVQNVFDKQLVGPVVCKCHHLCLFNLLDDLVLPLVEGDKEHVHVLERRALLVQLRLQDRVVHQIYSSHATDHYVLRLISRVVTLVM
jgi:hypothetical protein